MDEPKDTGLIRRTFVLTEQHLLLLSRAYVTWQDCETGAPEINPKRPYGNSDVAGDVAEILGWEVPDEDDQDALDALEDRAMNIHRETQTALQVVLTARSFEPGLYEAVGWDYVWRRAK